MGEQVLAIDGWATLNSHTAAKMWPESFRHIFRRYGVQERFEQGQTVAQMLAEMDAAGVEKVILSAFQLDGVQIVSNDEVGRLCAQHPERFAMACTVDPRDGMQAYHEVQRCVQEYGCRCLRLEPYAYGNGKVGLAPNDKLYYPLYAKCCELDIAVALQVGHTGPLWPSECGRPIYLDEVALTFPDLRLIGTHIGQPWHDEMMILAWKFPNVYVETSARAPKHWPESFLQFVRSYGQDKVIWGTDYPLLSFQRCRDEVAAHGFAPAVERKLLRENALRAFRL